MFLLYSVLGVSVLLVLIASVSYFVCNRLCSPHDDFILMVPGEFVTKYGITVGCTEGNSPGTTVDPNSSAANIIVNSTQPTITYKINDLTFSCKHTSQS